MSRLTFLSLIGALLVGCGTGPGPDVSRLAPSKAREPSAGSAEVEGEFIVGQPVVYGNLTVFPVSSRAPRNEDRFITLDEGLKSGTVQILEVGANSQATSRASTDTPSDSAVPDQVSPSGEDPVSQNPFAQLDDPFADPRESRDPHLGDETAQQGSEDPFQAGESHDMPGDDPFGAGSEVNRVLVLNQSDQPLYLMPGEIIVGGDQDRAIGTEMVIQPSQDPVPIDVFCVEHGRWGGRGADNVALLESAGSFEGNLSLVISQSQSVEEAAEEADKGKFVATAGSLNKPARLAVQDSRDQSQVWEKVAIENAKAKVQLPSGAFTGQYVEEEAVLRLKPYVDALHQPVAETKQVVGVIVAINGKVEMMDIFESTPLFNKLWPKLLKSYALDAANASELDEDVGQNRVCTRENARQFLSEALTAATEDSTVERGIALTKRSSERLLTYSAEDPEAAGMGGFGGFGGSVHTSGFSR